MQTRPAMHWLAAMLMALALGGCSSLLPRGSSESLGPFDSFAHAQAAAQRIVAFQTRTSELKALGFDLGEGKNVVMIPYPEVLSRLAPYSGVPMDALDPGIRQCILARTDCRAYLFHFERQQRQREGGFWYDFFNLRRVTRTTGWWFEALVVVSDGTVLFRNSAGQAHSERIDRQINPLGPFQPAGEGAGALLLR